MSLTVKAAGTGSTASGIVLRVRVLDNAILPSNLNTATANSDNVTITPQASGGLVFSATIFQSSSAPVAGGGNTAIDSIQQGIIQCHANYVSTSTTTAGTAFTAGSASSPTTPAGIAALEVQKYGGSIATNASSPAVVNNSGSTTGTTAAFSPPAGGKLILAMVTTGGGAGQATCVVNDSYGLTWKEAVKNNSTGNAYAGLWYAYTPAAPSLVLASPVNGTLGTAYSYTFLATGGYAGGYTWSVASGSVPTGLSLSSAGVLSGTPTVAGVFTFTVTATDSFSNAVTSSSISVVINKGTTPGGVVPATWSGAAPAYSYGTLQIPVTNADHDWVFVSVSWVDGQDLGIAYCADDVRNTYQPVAFSSSGIVNTQVFAAPNARAASTVYVSTSAYVRWLEACVLDVAGLQPGYVVDVTNTYSGTGTTLAMSLTTTQPDFVLAAGAFRGVPGTITPSGSGASWTTSAWSGINGNASDGLTQAVSWAKPSGAASPAMTYTATSAAFSGCMIAVYSQAGLAVNSNPAWPVTTVRAAFGYTPQEPTAQPVWTDVTSRFLGFSGGTGVSFELDEVHAADMTLKLDNFDGALSPQNTSSPYYPNVTLITPVEVLKTWQGRTYPVFKGVISALPQTYDYQRTMTAAALTDDYSKLAQTLLPTTMIQEMLYDKPLELWPLNDQQGAVNAGNWSGRSNVNLVPAAASGGSGATSSGQFNFQAFGRSWPIIETATTAVAGSSSTATSGNDNTPNTGFGNSNSGTFPGGLAGTTDTVWGNTTTSGGGTAFAGSVLVDSNDNTLPLTSTGATYSVWAQMYATNTAANLIVLTDSLGTGGTHNYLTVSYDGSIVTVAQTSGSHTYTPATGLFDGQWHLWTVTITTGGTITTYLDGTALGSFAGSFPAGTPSWLQFGGDSTASTLSTAGIFTGCQALGGTYDRVVDAERIQSWYQSGATGFVDELAGQRIQRVLAWARWNRPQAIDPGLTMQQPFNYLTGGYASNGLTGAVGNYNTAGGSAAVDFGAQADMTIQDIASTDCGFLLMAADGAIRFRQPGAAAPAALPLGDMDYALNAWQEFESGLGPWTNTSSCTVAQSAGWSYDGHHSALLTVTGTPPQAYVRSEHVTLQPQPGNVSRVGAFLDPSAMNVADWNASVTQWTGYGLPSPPVARHYKAPGDFTIDSDMNEMIADGVKICLTLRPAYNPVSSSDYSSIVSMMQSLKASGANVEVCLWHEPFYAGLTAPQYIAMVQYYAAAVRAYYPLVFVTAVPSVQANNENSYYPGDNWIDKCATDFYCFDYSVSGYTLDLAATPANSASPPKPFGIWETGSSTDPVLGQNSTQYGNFITYMQSYMQGRLNSGKVNADILWFNGVGYNLLTGNDTSFETGVGHWTVASGCTIASSTAQAHTGTHSMAITATGSGAASVNTGGGTGGNAVIAGTVYTYAAWVRAATTTAVMQLGVNWYNSSGTFLSSSFPSAGTSDTTGWTQIAITVTAPAGAAFAQSVVQTAAPGGAGVVHYVDDVTLSVQTHDSTIMGFGFGSAPSADYRISPWNALSSALDNMTVLNAGASCWVMSPQGCYGNIAIDFYNGSGGYISTASTPTAYFPPMTPVFLSLPGPTGVSAAAANAVFGPTVGNSPATGTQLYFDHPRLSPAGFQCPYEDDVEILEDVQYLYNDVAITRNVDQATYRARDSASRSKYYPRIYTRILYSSTDDPNAVTNCANTLVSAFSTPQLRVSRVTVKAASNPEAWPFVLGTGVGDSISFTRTPVGGAVVTGTFTVLHIEPDLGPDKANFTYVLAPSGFS